MIIELGDKSANVSCSPSASASASSTNTNMGKMSNPPTTDKETIHLEPSQDDQIAKPYLVAPLDVQLQVKDSGKRVALFCSSYSDIPVSYFKAAQRIGTLLAQRGCALIYGGGSWGLMGVVASTMDQTYQETICNNSNSKDEKSNSVNRSIAGICPSFMMESAGHCYGQTVIVNDMAERKQLINNLADVFLILPGGFGTMDEMTEVLTWNQLGYMNKLVAILNTENYFDGWWQWCQRAVQEGFIKPVFVENIIIAQDPEELIEKIFTTTLKPISGKYFTKA